MKIWRQSIQRRESEHKAKAAWRRHRTVTRSVWLEQVIKSQDMRSEMESLEATEDPSGPNKGQREGNDPIVPRVQAGRRKPSSLRRTEASPELELQKNSLEARRLESVDKVWG